MSTTIDHNDIRWRVSNTWDNGKTKMGMLVGYIDSRTCMDALDALDANWAAEHGEPIIVQGQLVGVPCRVTVNGVTRSDVGMPSSVDAIKGAYSDALKRAAVHFGIGRELYELPKIAVECEVAPSGKVKAPKALPVYRNGRWDIDRKYGWVRYDRDPDEQPERAERPAQAGRRAHPQAATTPAPAASLRDELIETMRKHGLGPDDLERYSDEVGIPEGQKATDAQLRQIIALIEQPGQDSTPEVPAAGAHPAPASPTMEDILAVTGGEEIPPRPNTPEYGSLEPPQKASARAYWAKRDREAAERPDAEQLKAAVA